jgi:hypothetical protein
MNKGEKEMAVVTFNITADGKGGFVLNPNPNSVVFVNGDYLIFKRPADGTVPDVNFSLLGAGGLPVVAVAVSDSTGKQRVRVAAPTIDKDGKILLAFEHDGGSLGGFPPG